MEPVPETMFYKNANEENSVQYAKTFFENITSVDDVFAEYETDSVGMMELHNHMNSSSTWKSISGWESGIHYIIDHPEGDITLTDLNRGQNTSIYRETVSKRMDGTSVDKSTPFYILRTQSIPLDFSVTSCHSSRYKWVTIESKKKFKYESDRASWVFHLTVIWEGKTREEASNSEKKYVIGVSMGSIDKASRDPVYTAASFMEKLLYILFQNSASRHVVFK